MPPIRIMLEYASDRGEEEAMEFSDAEAFVAFLKRTDLHKNKHFDYSWGFAIGVSDRPGVDFDVIVRDNYIE